MGKQQPEGDPSPGSTVEAAGLWRPDLLRVLRSAARLQEVVPGAVLVGGAAAAVWASHRSSDDHDHVLVDARWPDWKSVAGVCLAVAGAMLQ